MSLSKYEQEVVITFNADGDTADLYTANPAWIRKMDKLMAQNPDQFKLVEVQGHNGRIISKRYTVPKRFISIRSKDVKRALTEAQRAEMVERLKRR